MENKDKNEYIQDRHLDKMLRPDNWEEYIGQDTIKANVRILLQAAAERNHPAEHILFYGPPGLGKTTLSHIIAKEMGVNIRITSGPAIEKVGDLGSILTNLEPGDVLFIDEIHRLNKSIEEVLYPAMEDYKLDIIIGKGPSARTIQLDLPKFTVIGATTRTGSLAAPLRDRFGLIHRLEFYTHDEITRIITRTATILKSQIDPTSAQLLSTRARLTPRIANRLFKRVRDYADVNGDGIIDTNITESALAMLEIDELGLDPADRHLLLSILTAYGDRPVGLTTIAALTGDEATTIEDFYEPYLMQIGFIERTPRGRRVTPKASVHLGKTPLSQNKLV